MYVEGAMSRRQVFLLNPEQIDHYWADILQCLASCPGYYEFYTPEWTYERAKSGDLQIWGLSDGVIRGIVISQIVNFPRQRVFEVLGAAGVELLNYFDEMEEIFEFIAEDSGCQTMQARVRPGIERLLKKKKVLKRAVWIYRQVGKRREH
jgi:hypothetical protein